MKESYSVNAVMKGSSSSWKAKIQFFYDEKVSKDLLYVKLTALHGRRKKWCNVEATIDKKITRAHELKNAVISTSGSMTKDPTSESLCVLFYQTRSGVKGYTTRTIEFYEQDFSFVHRFLIKDPEPIDVD